MQRWLAAQADLFGEVLQGRVHELVGAVPSYTAIMKPP